MAFVQNETNVVYKNSLAHPKTFNSIDERCKSLFDLINFTKFKSILNWSKILLMRPLNPSIHHGKFSAHSLIQDNNNVSVAGCPFELNIYYVMHYIPMLQWQNWLWNNIDIIKLYELYLPLFLTHILSGGF